MEVDVVVVVAVAVVVVDAAADIDVGFKAAAVVVGALDDDSVAADGAVGGISCPNWFGPS